jgi:hypothetical protein
MARPPTPPPHPPTPRPPSHPPGLAPPPLQRLWSLAQLQLFGFDQLAARGLCQLLLEHQPSCALCHWCLALAAGPHPNKVADAQPQAFAWFGAEDAAAAERSSALALQMAARQLGAGRHAGQVRGAADWWYPGGTTRPCAWI